MDFVLLGHGVQHLRIGSDSGHRFMFQVVQVGRSRAVVASTIEWAAGRTPADRAMVLDRASHFASLCAQEFGLL